MRSRLAIVFFALVTPFAAAQTELQRVDAGVSDVDPLATSLREANFATDLRHDTAFEYVYVAPGRPDSLMRVAGGLTAVFPRSVYIPTAFGKTPVIPANTVFYVGGIPETITRGANERAAASRLKNRVTPVEMGGLAADLDEAVLSEWRPDRSPGRADMGDEAYRRQRLSQLTNRLIERRR
ncbi:MAG: hypothetical protein RIB58_04285 [Phycisphaerales bacterium]